MAASPADGPAVWPRESVPWEPVITRPDPVTAEEWEAWLDCEPAEWTDPDAYPDEEDYLPPGELDLTEAELAEIAAATALAAPVTADDADPAGVARVLAAQAAAASARRRGPGQPGSARLLARESSSAAAAFGTGQCLDVLPACPDLAGACRPRGRPGRRIPGRLDDELIGVLCAVGLARIDAAARQAGPWPRNCPPPRRPGNPVVRPTGRDWLGGFRRR